jgi:hypothetical protein
MEIMSQLHFVFFLLGIRNTALMQNKRLKSCRNPKITKNLKPWIQFHFHVATMHDALPLAPTADWADIRSQVLAM